VATSISEACTVSLKCMYMEDLESFLGLAALWADYSSFKHINYGDLKYINTIYILLQVTRLCGPVIHNKQGAL
jgi:hypothetical protein